MRELSYAEAIREAMDIALERDPRVFLFGEDVGVYGGAFGVSDGRMTVCNMAIEAGARVGFVAVDDTTISYLRNRTFAPKGDTWDKAVTYWRTLVSDEGACFDSTVCLDAGVLQPQVTWGTSPEMVTGIDGAVPAPEDFSDPVKSEGVARALNYMGLVPRTPITQIAIDKVFIGSCTNSRIEDLRIAAGVIKGRQRAESVKLALVVPGSGLVKAQAEAEGLDKIFIAAGFEWRHPGCSMCLAMICGTPSSRAGAPPLSPGTLRTTSALIFEPSCRCRPINAGSSVAPRLSTFDITRMRPPMVRNFSSMPLLRSENVRSPWPGAYGESEPSVS